MKYRGAEHSGDFEEMAEIMSEICIKIEEIISENYAINTYENSQQSDNFDDEGENYVFTVGMKLLDIIRNNQIADKWFDKLIEDKKPYGLILKSTQKLIENNMTYRNIKNKGLDNSDEYNEDSRMEYLEQLYSELNNIEFKVMGILKNFNMESVLAESYKEYFKKAKENFSELGYGSQHENLSKIYQKIFTDMKPQLVEKAKNTFAGYTFYGGLSGTSRIINEVGSINELLHIMHSSIINDQDLLQSMPIIGTKKNEFSYNIVLYGEENKISQEIFEKFPKDLDVGDTDIVSMEDRTLMMIRDRGHALTIDIDSLEKDNVVVNYFVPKICNKEMVKALPGINPSSITKNGAVGTFDLKKGDIKKIFDFIGKVPTDMDMPEIGVQYNNSAVFKEENNVENEPKENDILTDSKNEALFNEADANSLASNRKLGEVKNAFYKLKEFIKSKNISKQKGEEKE